MAQKNKSPEIRFKGFMDEWKEREYTTTFTNIANNTLSREELNYNSGLAKNVHYGDVLIKFGELLDVQKDEIPYITDDAIVNKLKSSRLENGDVIIADAAEDETVGKCTELVNIGKETVVSGLHTIVIRPTLFFASGYLGYFMNSPAYHTQLLRLMQGTKVLSISKTAIKNTTIFHPMDTVEQSQISDLFKNIDQNLTLHQSKYDKLVNVKKAMLEKMFPKNAADVPEIRFKGFTGAWEKRKVCELFKVTRGNVLAATKTSEIKTENMPYPVYSSQTKNNGLMGYYKEYLFENAITWTTDGANAGTVNYRPGKFYSTNVNGVLLSNEGHANKAITEALNKIAWKHVSHVGNPKLMNNVMSEINISVPSSLAEQMKISSFFINLDDLLTLHHSKLQKLKNIKKSMLEKMFV